MLILKVKSRLLLVKHQVLAQALVIDNVVLIFSKVQQQMQLKKSGQGGTASTSNSWIPSNNSAHAFSGTVIARQDGTDGDNYAAWEVKGAVMKADNAASMVVGAAIINSLYHTSGASAWAVTIAANTTLGSAEVKVTGASSTNISWVTTIDTSEVVNP